mmetsp:Transcript_33336/g.65944  ORF Transcript_33336/g.65944 Transcript_33336/m.65944 type:complete len:91 (-) Transcript_33336:334-606(-)
MLNSESPYPEDNIFHSAPNEETLQSQKCEDDPTFFDNLGNSCSDYNTLGCSNAPFLVAGAKSISGRYTHPEAIFPGCPVPTKYLGLSARA